MAPPALHLAKVERRYDQAGAPLEVLRGADFSLWSGQSVALVAPSGAGKSTLLHIAGLLERPDAGEVFIAGEATNVMADDARTAIRRGKIGFVYQFHHLLPEFTALENIILPQMIAGLSRAEAQDRAAQLLHYLGLSKREGHLPSELSGGEQQRVAIARAVANGPGILLADEPTGNLDPHTAAGVHELFHKLNRELGITMVIATHNEQLTRSVGRALRLNEGKLVDEAR
jgi:lipoprotein-releasing system ATP-binding protein